MKHSKTIAFLIHCGIGNLILATPCLRALRSIAPDANLYLLTSPETARILEDWETVDLIVSEDNLAFLKSLRRPADCLILSPAGALWDSTMKDSAQRVMTQSINGPWRKHEVEYNMDFAAALGYTGPVPSCQVKISDRNFDNANKAFKKYGIDSDRAYICVNASYRKYDHWHLKHWGDEKYVELIREIRKTLPFDVILIGDRSDIERGNHIAHQANVVGEDAGLTYNLCGFSCDIKDTAAIISDAVCVIGNDGGLMHIAAAVHVPTVTIFTFTDSIKNRPWHNPFVPNRVVMNPCQHRISCEHGQWEKCRSNGCLDVPVNIVLEAVLDLVNSIRHPILECKRSGIPSRSGCAGV